MSNIVKFHDHEMTVISLEGRPWLRGTQIGGALGVPNPAKAVQKIYHRHRHEFTPDMTTLLDMSTAGGMQLTRIFSPRGAALIAMLSNTARAADFRAWVLDVLERKTQPPAPSDLASLLAQPQKPYGWDIWPQTARYAALGLDGGEIARLIGRQKAYVGKTLQAMRKAGLVPPLPGSRPQQPLLTAANEGDVA